MPVNPITFAARIRGVFGFPVTPFHSDLSLDLDALEDNIDDMAARPFYREDSEVPASFPFESECLPGCAITPTAANGAVHLPPSSRNDSRNVT
jgi:hypothetical protein